MKPPIEFHWKGNHHSYHGLWMILFGLFQWYMGIDNKELTGLIPIWQTFIGAGLLLLIDDIIEHTWTGNTPLRIIYKKIIIPILKNIRIKEVDK